MSSKFLERLDEIREGQPARLGFGAARAQRTPGMALVIDVGDWMSADIESAVALSPDAIIVRATAADGVTPAGANPADAETIGGLIRGASWRPFAADGLAVAASAIGGLIHGANWGPITASGMSADDTDLWRKYGADLIVFSLQGTALDAVTSRDAARILLLPSNESPEDLRDIAPLPVDAVLINLPGNPAQWTLQNLAAVARISGRVGKPVLARISGAPAPGALEALRDAGVIGLVLELSRGTEPIKKLQADLLDLPKPGARRRSRPSAILPGSVYAPRRPAPADDPDDDDD